jgi:hypothetical protein
LVENRGTPRRIKNAFLSKLPVASSLLFNKDVGLGSAKLVFSPTRDGTICWPVIPHSVEGQRGLKLDLRDGATWSYIHITDPGKWLCQSASAIPPALLKDLRPEDGRPHGIRIVITDNKIYGIVKLSALNGFPGWTCADMKDLVRYFDVPCDVIPSLQKEL